MPLIAPSIPRMFLIRTPERTNNFNPTKIKYKLFWNQDKRGYFRFLEKLPSGKPLQRPTELFWLWLPETPDNLTVGHPAPEKS